MTQADVEAEDYQKLIYIFWTRAQMPGFGSVSLLCAKDIDIQRSSG